MKSFLEETREGLVRSHELNMRVLEVHVELMVRLDAFNQAARAAGFSSFLQIIFGQHHDLGCCSAGTKIFLHARIASGWFSEGNKTLEKISRAYGFDWAPFRGGVRLHAVGAGPDRCEVTADLHDEDVLGWRPTSVGEALAA